MSGSRSSPSGPLRPDLSDVASRYSCDARGAGGERHATAVDDEGQVSRFCRGVDVDKKSHGGLDLGSDDEPPRLGPLHRVHFEPQAVVSEYACTRH